MAARVDCKDCGAPRDGSNKTYCKKCHSIRVSRSRAAHPETRKESDRRYREANREKINARHREWSRANPRPRRHTKESERAYTLKKYGLTPEDFETLWEAQDGLCGICKTALERQSGRSHKGNRVAVVDHCHETGEVRGLLCRTCNTGIGHLRDNEDVLLAAAQWVGQGRVVKTRPCMPY